MRGLLLADWIRFRHRYDLWIVLFAVLALGVLGYVSGALSAGNQIGSSSIEPTIDPSLPPDIRAEIEAQNAQMVAQMTAQMAAVQALYVFPRSIVTILGGGGTWLFMAAAFVAASWIASEFDWGTIRNVVLTRPERGSFLAARLVSLVVVMTVALVILAAFGAILPVLVPVAGGQPSGVTPLAILETALGGWTWSLAFIVVAALAAVLVRSPIFALILTYGYFLLDALVVNLPVWNTVGLDWLPQLLLGARLSALNVDIRTATGLTEPYAGPPSSAFHLDPIVGLLVIAAWISVVLVLAYVVLRRADIRE